MPVRKDYPIPECPSCRKSDSRVLNTFYTKDRQIVRLRECNFCSHRIYTQQHAESTIDISKTKIPNSSLHLRQQDRYPQTRHPRRCLLTPCISPKFKASLASALNATSLVLKMSRLPLTASSLSTGYTACLVVPMASTQDSGSNFQKQLADAKAEL